VVVVGNVMAQVLSENEMDHEVVNLQSSSISCGVVQISRISDEEGDKVLFAIANSFYHPARGNPPAFAIFSNVVDTETSASRLASLVERHSFGYVEKSAPAFNPRTGNLISIWTWAIAHETFKKFYTDKRIEKAKAIYT